MNEVGNKYGAWTVIAAGAKQGTLRCSCACMRTTKDIRRYDLVHGLTLMCRRCSVSRAKKNAASEGGKCSPEYVSWVHMIQRCHNPKNKDYKNYGARGISVCDMWRESFETFLLMVGKRPAVDYTIERIDPNGNYEPGNVTWATRAEQNRNTRSNVKLTVFGETKTVAEWGEDPRRGEGVSLFTIYKRINRGWDAAKAVTTPSNRHTKQED